MKRGLAAAGVVSGALSALLAASLFVRGLPLVGASRTSYAAFATATLLTFTLACFLVAALIALRSREPMAIYAAVMIAVLGGAGAPYTDAVAALPGWFVPARLGVWLLIALVVGFLILFPTFKPVPPWALALFAVWAVATLAVMLATPLFPPGNPPDAWGQLMFVGFIGGIASQVWRWRKEKDAIASAQRRWVLFGLGVAIVATIVGSALPAISPTSDRAALGFAIVTLGSLAIPVTIAVSVTRYRLWNVDLAINRAAVYTLVAAILIALYLGIVLVAEALTAGRGQTVLSLIAAAAVAVTFQPLRFAVQRGVNRLMYGDRDEPRVVLRRLGAALDGSAAGDTVLPLIATTVASALRLPYVGVVLSEGGVFAAGKVDDVSTPLLRIPLSYQGEAVGELHLAPRSSRDPFTPGDVALLRELAVHIGVASHAVLLGIQLQQSRERLVNARAEERRRLRRDLHDGLGPQLVSLALKLEAARNRAQADEDMQRLLTELATQTRGVIADVRRLVYALRPPALDELGLLGALEQAGETAATNLHFVFEKPEAIPQLPAAVEVATYRIAQEALTNVVRHSRAHSCKLKLTMVHGGLNLEVTDDGTGMAEGAPTGIGLNSMRERAEELGGRLEVGASESGGGRVTAFLPYAAEA